mmetsp:Transcript_10216/g.15349  ORF Transcript_10216/g.15349 Transcript_10216/m.15349 type:complete len:504 (+) Transcript_10216:162-1673(+)|eukprot:CAMPEP_0203673188 /NCGR_PEP_ID=MMETSP0090-20130426/11252_1 /ASSEMBLY_ACC=CAM_ASM_001088 /TAXON_ID=426623 /ORGANISM="Chaetoceros affinis, Strain CCMP159" /LENGTH=503 /DNA_ID=CAMNT_0050538775 /DNA_START=83 /DNA_END=1594 /DNA_ORIENTATION=-
MSARRSPPWVPADINESSAEAVTILRYWDVTTPPPKNAKLGAFRRSKRYRRISLEMHRVPREVNQNSLELRDIFPDHVPLTGGDDYHHHHHTTCDKAFFRISKYVPIKGNNLADDATVISDVSARTKDRYSKPDYEWRTKFLLEVSRVAITEIKNDKEVFFEAWNDGEVIARSLVFKEISQANEFSYDLERLANEDPDLNDEVEDSNNNNTTQLMNNTRDHGPPRVIESKHSNSPGRKLFSTLNKKTAADDQTTPPTTPSHRSKEASTPQTVDTGGSITAPTGTRTSAENRTMSDQHQHQHQHQRNHKRRSCCKNFCRNFCRVIAGIFHFFGIVIALTLFLYAIAIYSIRPNPQSKIASIIFIWSVLIGLTHTTGIMGTGRAWCGSVCFLRTSVFLAVINILVNLSLLVVFTVREDDIVDYLRDHHDKLFLTVDQINMLNAHILWIYYLMVGGSIAEIMRICTLQSLKRDILRRWNEGSFGHLSTPLLNDEEMQGSRRRLNSY